MNVRAHRTVFECFKEALGIGFKNHTITNAIESFVFRGAQPSFFRRATPRFDDSVQRDLPQRRFGLVPMVGLEQKNRFRWRDCARFIKQIKLTLHYSTTAGFNRLLELSLEVRSSQDAWRTSFTLTCIGAIRDGALVDKCEARQAIASQVCRHRPHRFRPGDLNPKLHFEG
jgi:hypothetical protein